MTLIKEKLQELADKFKKVSVPDDPRINNMKKVAEAAKKVSREIKEQKG